MKIKPIIFNEAMVRALLSGKKSMTRRPVDCSEIAQVATTYEWFKKLAENSRWDIRPGAKWVVERAKFMEGKFFPFFDKSGNLFSLKSPFGVKGDLLWVRETYCDVWKNTQGQDSGAAYKADKWDHLGEGEIFARENVKWTPSIHMPRWASRLTLRITDIRVERLQDITEADAQAEGVDRISPYPSYKDGFIKVWQSIYGEGTWDENRWVWVVDFDAVIFNIDDLLAFKKTMEERHPARAQPIRLPLNLMTGDEIS